MTVEPGVVRVFQLLDPPLMLTLFVVDTAVARQHQVAAPFLAGVQEVVLGDTDRLVSVPDASGPRIYAVRPIARVVGEGVRPCTTEAEALAILAGARADYLRAGWRDASDALSVEADVLSAP